MTQLSDDIDAYAAYLNGRARAREEYSDAEFELFEEDARKAEAKMLDSYYGVSQ